jgi:hypothetical protein
MPRLFDTFRHLAIPSAAGLAIFAIFTTLSGCSSDGPQMRLGSIPFPGPFTLYSVADPADLGVHNESEVSRGILYTCRAGFLDLSHIRESVDIAKYAHDQLAASMVAVAYNRADRAICTIDWSDSHYVFSFHKPAWWFELDDAERLAISQEASILEAQRIAVIVGTWHEIGTWWGQETVPPFSEQNSALTWDDTTSHVIAAIVAGRALRDPQPWNQAVTFHLNEVLADLGVVKPACEDEAVQAVHGRWWWGGTPIRRDMDTGLAGDTKSPWLAPNLPCCPGATPFTIDLPNVSNVLGRDLRPCFELRIEPPRWMVRAALGCDSCPAALTSENDILAAIEHMRAAVKVAFGPDADDPYAPARHGPNAVENTARAQPEPGPPTSRDQ